MSKELWDENFDVKKEKVFCDECIYFREDVNLRLYCIAHEKVWVDDNPISRGRY